MKKIKLMINRLILHLNLFLFFSHISQSNPIFSKKNQLNYRIRMLQIWNGKFTQVEARKNPKKNFKIVINERANKNPMNKI